MHHSFGAHDHLSGPIVGEISATNEAIKDRQAVRRLVRAGILPADQMPPPPRRLTPFLTPTDAPPEMRAAVAEALTMPSLADTDEEWASRAVAPSRYLVHTGLWRVSC